MSNFNIRIIGSANLAQAQKQFAMLEAQINALNKQMQKTVTQSTFATNPKPYAAMSRAVSRGSEVFRDAAASTGLYEAQQLRVTSATEEYTKALQKQKVTFGEWRKSQKVAQAAYREQLAMQSMVVRQLPTTKGGKSMLDVVMPKNVTRDLDTIGNKFGWFREQVMSSSTQLVNWGKNTQWAGRQLMVGFTVPMAAFGAVAGKLAYDVNAQITRIQKVYNTTANQFSADVNEQKRATQELARLRVDSTKAAVDAAKQYGVAMKDTLGVEADLAATGLRGQKLIGSTTEVVKNAMLGEIDYATATKATVAMQQILHTSQKQTSDNWAYMNAIENATSLQMKDFAAAIPIALKPLKMMGGDVKTLGLLLTGMVSRGIQVGKAANAIKAAAQRLLRPSKQIREEFQALTGADITQIANRNKGNLLGMLQDIYKVTKDLNNESRGKVLAGLFGTYQLTTMSAMVDSMGDLEKGVGQVTTAYNVGQQSAEKWGEIQQKELKAIQQSASGRFKRAVETIKAEIATMGEPFLEIGTRILTFISKIISGFNSLPKFIKKGLAIGAILAALIGPMVMLTGLFANMIGTTIKMGMAFTKLFVKFELLDKESKAAQLAASLAAAGWDEMGNAARNTAVMIDKLSSSIRASAAAQRQAMAMSGTGLVGGNAATHAVARSGMYWENPTPGVAGALRQNNLPVPSVNEWGMVTPQIAKAEESTRKMSGWVKSTAISGGLFSAAMAASLISTNDTVEGISKIAMIAALLGPIIIPTFKAMKVATLWTIGKLAIVQAQMEAIALSGKSYAASLVAAPISTMGATLARLGGVLATVLTSTTAIVTGIGLVIGLVGYGLYRAYKKQRDLVLEQKKAQEAINNSTQTWADILGVAVKRYQQIGLSSPTVAGKGPTTQQQADQFAKTSTGKRIIGAYKSGDGGFNIDSQSGTLTGSGSKAVIAQKMYIDLLTKTNATAKQAQHALEVFFTAAGDGALAAQQKAAALRATIGDIVDQNDMGALWANQIGEGLKNEMGALNPLLKSIGSEVSNAIAQQVNKAGKDGVLNDFMKSVGQGWDRILSEQISPDLQTRLKNIGVTTGAQLKAFYGGQNIAGVDKNQQLIVRNQLQQQLAQNGAAQKLQMIEQSVVIQLARQLGITDKITTMKQLQATWEYQIYAVNRNQAKALYQQRIEAMKLAAAVVNAAGGHEKVTKAMKLQVLNQILVNKGLGTASTLQEGFAMLTGKSAQNQDGVTNAVKRTTNAMTMLKSAAKSVNLGQLMQNTMGGIETSIADATQKNFDSRMQASLDRTQAAGQARMEALQNHQQAAQEGLQRRQQKAQDAMDKRFQRREDGVSKAYDKRINNIKREMDAEKAADDLRKKLFDAEMARIDRLNEAQNRNIDFNAALNSGNFDEAAKIRNDSEAAAAQWSLQDALDKASGKSQSKQDKQQAKIDSLENVKQARLDNIKKIEDAEKAALQRRQQREQQAQQKHQEAVRKAAQAEVDANNKAAQKMWDDRKAYLAKALEDFTGYTATSSKDLMNHIKLWQQKYKGLNLSTSQMFNLTAQSINKYLVSQMEDSRRKILNDAEWSQFGDKIAQNMISGAFDMTKSQFFNWLATGKFPTKKKVSPKAAKAAHRQTTQRVQRGKSINAISHEGGYFGGAGDLPNSRKGYARNSPLSRNEFLTLAERGEFMANKNVVKSQGLQNFEALNQGKASIVPNDRSEKAHTGGFGAPTTTVGAAMMGAMMKTLIQSQVMASGIVARARDMAAAAIGVGKLGAAGAGTYGGRAYGQSQMKNAAIIASVGRNMGMSKRDIEIGIMTAITESGLQNLHHGDRDSQGLFQQRPSAGWGSVAQVTNPRYAAGKFFGALKGVGNRSGMAPWLAAQAVQRSAYSSGSNYRPYWDDAIAIMRNMSSGRPGSGSMGAVVQGSGGRHRPVAGGHLSQGLHDVSTGYPAVDIGVPVGTPVRAVGDGKIIVSKDLRGNDGRVSNGGYYSYGRYIVEALNGGGAALFAHLSQRGVRVGQHVKGGTTIGRSGNTGHSFGPHLHFGTRPMSPYSFLDTGGYIMSDGLAYLHKGEAALTKDQTSGMVKAVNNFANGGNSTYNIHMYGVTGNPNDIAKAVVKEIRKQESRKGLARRA